MRSVVAPSIARLSSGKVRSVHFFRFPPSFAFADKSMMSAKLICAENVRRLNDLVHEAGTSSDVEQIYGYASLTHVHSVW